MNKYELEKLNKEAISGGFESHAEKLNLIIKVDINEVGKISKFKRWETRDNTKQGLLEIIENKEKVFIKDLCENFPYAHYHINMDTGRLFNYFNECFNESPYKMHINPEFQRGHVWTKEQQIAFMEYLVRKPQDSKATSILLNCPKWHNWKDGEIVDIYLVDGLQRYTAIQRFLNNEIPIYNYYFNQFDNLSKRLLTHISMDIYINNLNYKDMLKWYVDCNSGGTMHTLEEINKVKKMIEDLK